jgi:MoxR-like ATPase
MAVGWTQVVGSGDVVSTPHGFGTVRRVSEINQTAQVEVNGQLFEVPLNQIQREAAPGGQPEGGDFKKGEQPVSKPVQPWKVKKGDRVQFRQHPERTGQVIDVTQRTVRVKIDSNGRVYAIPKRGVAKELDYQSGSPAPQPEGTKPEGDKPETAKDAKGVTPEQAGDVLYGMMQLKEHLEKKIDSSVDGELKALKEQVKATQKLEVKIGDKTSTIQGLKHKQLEQLITYAALRLHPLLIGMAGTGKTFAGQQTAEALNLNFYAMSVGVQTSKSDIIGYQDASGRYVRTHFRDAYENGGVFLMDEIDAGNANVLIQINAALSNGMCAFPDGMVIQHEDFVFIASANTFGNGANRQYVGRNQLDAATLDRFTVIEWLIDDELESNLAIGLNGKAWYMAVRAARDYVAEKNIRALISPRATLKGSTLLNSGQDIDEVILATMLGSVPEDKRGDVTEVAKKVFNKFASEVPGQLPKEVNPEVSELLR